MRHRAPESLHEAGSLPHAQQFVDRRSSQISIYDERALLKDSRRDNSQEGADRALPFSSARARDHVNRMLRPLLAACQRLEQSPRLRDMRGVNIEPLEQARGCGACHWVEGLR